MPNTPDLTAPCLTIGPVEDDTVLPVSPYYAMRYQFGQLLGVEDFEAAQAYARGKVRLHNAWMHGPGVVWGMRVLAPPTGPTTPALSGEIQVLPGLALDGQGHELHLDGPACVNVAAWYAEHKDDPDVKAVTVAGAGGTVDLTLRVELRFKACLTREVPAMSEPCDGAGTSTAYSRAFETVELRLLPGTVDLPARPYHRLRLLFGIAGVDAALADPAAEAAAVSDVNAAKAAIAAAADPAAEFLRQFRILAALDEMDLSPGKTPDGSVTLFPGGDDAVVIANLLHVHLEPGATGLAMTSVEIHNEIRKVHVATSTIQELNCCTGAATAPAPGPGPGPVPAPGADAGGPRIIDAKIAARRITLVADKALASASVAKESFSITQFDEGDGWSDLEVKQVAYDATKKAVTIDLKETPEAALVRLLARGTGEAPILGADKVPLAGAKDAAAGSAVSGNDYVVHFGS
jgi:hypothetical protein